VSDPSRPDPDALLGLLKKQEEKAQRGKLKIFFGMCPGVGKTYAMLQAARRKHLEGVEVVAGVVETHGRVETQALLEGIPLLEPAQQSYRGITLGEMDLDALLVWHPKIVLVDELAHTNAPGSRHPKRYQDVLELLDAGIDVFTTLNVQHIESRKDAIAQITGIIVRETVPDSMLDTADELVLIDLTPDQLRERLADGKVYLGERALAASDNFFRETNLIALREMSLRLTAEHVDRDLRQLRNAQTVGEPWKAGDRLLVAVSASPSSEKLIRWTRRAAASMEASWIALHVETPRQLSSLDEVKLGLNLALARQLGAEVITAEGVEIGAALLRIAQQNNVSQIITGKPGARTWWNWWRPSPVSWLVRNSGDIDVHMVRAEASEAGRWHAVPSLTKWPWPEMGAGLLIAAGVTALGLILLPITGYWAIALVYLFAVIVSARSIGRRGTLLLATLSALLWDFLFIPPRFTFYIKEVRDFMMFAMYFIVAIVVGQLTARLREREQAERRGEARANALFQLTRALVAGRELADLVAIAVQQVKETFGAEAALLLREPGGGFSSLAHPASAFVLTQKEESVANWTFQKKQPAGRFTDTLPDAEAFYLPLLAGDKLEGVLALKLASTLPPTTHQRALMEAFAAQIALALEKDRLAQISRQAQVAAQSEQLQKTLFDTVSHELQTPLAAISAALEQAPRSPTNDEIQQAVFRLKSVVNNLLDMTRLESGLLKPNLEWTEVSELVHEAVQRAAVQTPGREVRITVFENCPPLRVDAGLLGQAIALLLGNAAAYSPAGSPIEITAAKGDGVVIIFIADSGPGLQPGEEQRVFEKFYRGSGVPTGGIGLGLSIVQRLVEANGGTITATNRGGELPGACFMIRLPATESMRLPEEK
jgi:two-component system sensor histidine kinase KdpD